MYVSIIVSPVSNICLFRIYSTLSKASVIICILQIEGKQIYQKKQENQITDSKQIFFEDNNHVSDRNDNTKEDIRRHTNIKNRSSNLKYDQVRKNSKRGGNKSYSEEEIFINISSGSSKNYQQQKSIR